VNLLDEVMYFCALCVYIVVKVSRGDLFEYVCRYSNIISKHLTQYRSILNQHGQTALLTASDLGYASVVKLLIDAKADVNLANKV
jgi:ankyrin repeat protein